jgi:hypothetical protein
MTNEARSPNDEAQEFTTSFVAVQFGNPAATIIDF